MPSTMHCQSFSSSLSSISYVLRVLVAGLVKNTGSHLCPKRLSIATDAMFKTANATDAGESAVMAIHTWAHVHVWGRRDARCRFRSSALALQQSPRPPHVDGASSGASRVPRSITEAPDTDHLVSTFLGYCYSYKISV